MPSGSFSNCNMVASVPTSYRSSGWGSSRSAFWLCDQEYLLAGIHGAIKCDDGFFTPDKKRNHHVRIYDDVAQWQNRHAAHIIHDIRDFRDFRVFVYFLFNCEIVFRHRVGPRFMLPGSACKAWGHESAYTDIKRRHLSVTA